MSISLGLNLAERGLIPTAIERQGIRALLRQRLSSLGRDGAEEELIEKLLQSPIALETDTANEQHYELPPEFFEIVLGPYLKYSSAYWPDGVADLGAAEERMLELTCDRAELVDGMDILELGCGWGSLSLFMANRFPDSRITVVSNSAPQRQFIEAKAPKNLAVITADMNDFTIDEKFDRVVSIEMFEHMRNYGELFNRIAGWTKPNGKLFVHVFCHKSHSYEFETEGAGNWMGRYFFTAGLMPSFDLLTRFDRDFKLEDSWPVSGVHYQRTAAAWRENLERNRDAVQDVFKSVYGSDANKWYHRWRLFFLACEELFGFRRGEEWLVGHYRFVPAREVALTG
jgi:cyclopropane-fatty-acyl-phospholipid synthase